MQTAPTVEVMVAASTWRPRQPSPEGTNATDLTSTAPAARTPGPAKEMVPQPFFENGRRPTGCLLPSITTSRRSNQIKSFLMVYGAVNALTRNALTDFTDHALTFSEGFFISKWDGPEA